MVSQFVDISDFQPDIDWDQYKSWAEQGDGISQVAIKSSEGVGFEATTFQAHRAGALAAGIDRLIFYHFARPDLNSALDEAQWQFQVVGQCRSQDILILDFEVQDPLATSEWAFEWLVQQQQNYAGKLPGIYASLDYILTRLQDTRLAQYPLWLADWQYDPNERPPSPGPWSKYDYLQYTDSAANIPGIPGTVDANIFLGGNPSMIDLGMAEVAAYFQQAPGNAWLCKQSGNIIGNAILDTYRGYGNNSLKGLYYLGLPVSNEYPAGTTPGNTQQDFELGRLVYDTDGSLGGRPGQAKGVYPTHVLPQPDQASIDSAAQSLNAAAQSIQAALTALGK